jgi:hypothetical protein
MEAASSSDSNASVTSMTPALATCKPKKKEVETSSPRKPTENHFEIRAVVSNGEEWDLDLEEVHGLMDQAACGVVSIAIKYVSQDEFPPVKGNRFVDTHRLGALPRMQQPDGVWKMFR